jgi:hypothetical protein
LTFAAGDTSKTVSVTVAGDTLDEDDETLTLTLSSATGGAGIGTATATGTITDDDASPTLSVADADAVSEGNAPATTTDMSFTVTLSAASGRDVSVPYTLGGTATAGSDYEDPQTKSVTISAGSTSAAIVIKVKGDTLDEDNETIEVTLGTPGNATLSSEAGAGTASGTITDDDDAPELSVDAPSVAEGADESTATLSFTVTLSAASGRQVTVAYADAGTGTATSGTDYTALTAGTLTFAAGETSKTVAVTVTGDDDAEDDETVVLRLSSASNATLKGGAATLDATGTITDDDTTLTVTLSAISTSITEGNPVTLTATLSKAAPPDGLTLTLTAKSESTATAGDDYETLAGIEIGSGEESGDTTIKTLDDNVVEFISRNVPGERLVLTAAGPGTSVSPPLTITIVDNDGPSWQRPPGQPTLTPVTTGNLAPTSTTLSFAVSCVSPGGAPVTDYIVWAVNKDDPDESHVRDFIAPDPDVAAACSTILRTMEGLPSRAGATTYVLRVQARNLRGIRGPWSDPVEMTTPGSAQQRLQGSPSAAPAAVSGIEVLAAAGAGGVWREGDAVEATVSFNTPVTVDTAQGTPRLALIADDTVRTAAYARGSGTASLVFAWRVPQGNGPVSGVRVAAAGLVLGGGTITGENGDDALLGFGTPPGVTAVSVAPPADGTWSEGDTLEVTVRFAEPVVVSTANGTPALS